jgi:hypothetical protein
MIRTDHRKYHVKPDVSDKLLRILRLLESDQEGEREGAAHAAHRLLKAGRLTMSEALGICQGGTEKKPRKPAKAKTPSPDEEPWHIRRWAGTCRVLLQQHSAHLSTWEMAFCNSLIDKDRPLSPKQASVLLNISQRFTGRPS